MNLLRPFLVPIVWSLVGWSCSHTARLVPDKSAKTLVGADSAAVAVVGGVRCSAEGEWNGNPEDLGSEVVPVRVRIKNSSGRPIRLLYEEFALVGKNGRRYRPFPLVPMPSATKTVRALHPLYLSDKFFVAPRLSAVYQTLPAWPNLLPRDELFYQVSYARWGDEPPSFDMLTKGMPEGVLADGGTITGFLYFDGLASRENSLVFKADVEESDHPGERVALIEIPFRVE